MGGRKGPRDGGREEREGEEFALLVLPLQYLDPCTCGKRMIIPSIRRSCFRKLSTLTTLMTNTHLVPLHYITLHYITLLFHSTLYTCPERQRQQSRPFSSVIQPTQRMCPMQQAPRTSSWTHMQYKLPADAPRSVHCVYAPHTVRALNASTVAHPSGRCYQLRHTDDATQTSLDVATAFSSCTQQAAQEPLNASQCHASELGLGKS